MANSKVYVIIVNYNNWQDTIECLESLLRSDYDNYQILVVDNGSVDGSMEKMTQWAKGNPSLQASGDAASAAALFSSIVMPVSHLISDRQDVERAEQQLLPAVAGDEKITLIRSHVNNGFAAGNNLAIRHAQQKGDFGYIWLLNNDTIVRPDTLSSLVCTAADKGPGIFGSMIFYYDHPDVVQTIGGGSIDRLFAVGKYIREEGDLTQLSYIHGASFLITREVIEDIGLLPEDYFLYYEETDYCFEAVSKGYNLGVAMDSVIYHKEGASTGCNSLSNRKKSVRSDQLMIRNRILFAKKHDFNLVYVYAGAVISIVLRLMRGELFKSYKVLKTLVKTMAGVYRFEH